MEPINGWYLRWRYCWFMAGRRVNRYRQALQGGE